MIKTKIFFGSANNQLGKGMSADEKANAWLEENPDIDILQMEYQQIDFSNHSICIMYAPMTVRVNTFSEPTYEELTKDLLVELGVSRSLAGFNYTAWAVERVCMDANALRDVSKGLYTAGGEYFNTSWRSFERAVRYIVEYLHNMTDSERTDTERDVFGDGIKEKKIMNRAFLSILAAEVKRRKKLEGVV